MNSRRTSRVQRFPHNIDVFTSLFCLIFSISRQREDQIVAYANLDSSTKSRRIDFLG